MPSLQMVSGAPTPSRLSMLAEGLGKSIARGFPTPEQVVQERRLSQAFQKLNQNPDASFEEKLQSILPVAISTPGGAEALNAALPLLYKNYQQKGWEKFVNQKNKEKSGQRPNYEQNQYANNTNDQIDLSVPPPLGQSPEDAYRYGINAKTEDSLFPSRTAGPKTIPKMTPDEKDQYVLDYMRSSPIPVPLQEAQAAADRKEVEIENYNNKIREEQKNVVAESKDLFSNYWQRTTNEGLLDAGREGDKIVLERVLEKTKNISDPSKRSEAVRDELRDYNTQKQKIEKAGSLPYPIQKQWQQIKGNYKDLEQIGKSIKEPIQYMKNLGLVPELRNMIQENIGTGPEDTELLIFPPSHEEKMLYSKIPNHPDPNAAKMKKVAGTSIEDPNKIRDLTREELQNFKNDLEPILNHPKLNLIAMRGYIMRDRNYNWRSVSDAVNELIAEGRFKPDRFQDQELVILNNPPVPGLLEMFDYDLKGTK